ncbi:hypothetical protein DPMN_032425 [Dreissena polymorpha]|uniref:Uncharacterized protein n=1 Tax=Dreissena polymorpha TaxID=45954 RepID=A0A9D4M6J4_DREPO|nr:hypothetical protein DPMN_032425 [Dreissena polymorpha]
MILWANETLDIPCTVQNAGAVDQNIDVRIEDDQDFALEPKVHGFNLKSGMKETGQFTIKGSREGGVTTQQQRSNQSLQQSQIKLFHHLQHLQICLATDVLSTSSSQLTGSTKANANGNPGASTSTIGGKQFPASTAYSSSVS